MSSRKTECVTEFVIETSIFHNSLPGLMSKVMAQKRGRTGVESNAMLASCGVRLALRRLHGAQAVTTFSQSIRPPRERGMM